MFQFESLSAFFAMGGHGPYVWSAYGISIALLIWMVWMPLKRKKTLLRQVERDMRRQAAKGREE